MTTQHERLLKPRLGLGTWQMGRSASDRAKEVAAIRAGIERGVTVIDTAEMYASGGAEAVTGEAIADVRNDVFVVTKVLPANASRRGAVEACLRSLERLRVDTVDLYLLHWKSQHPLQETIEAFETLRERGLIRSWGVSNFDTTDMKAMHRLENGDRCVANQVYYSLGARGVEYDLLPWQAAHSVATMAYCPLDQGRLVNDKRLRPLAQKHDATHAQIALAYLMLDPHVIPIPKSSNPERVVENAAARDIILDVEDRRQIDALFSPPTTKVPLKTS